MGEDLAEVESVGMGEDLGYLCNQLVALDCVHLYPLALLQRVQYC